MYVKLIKFFFIMCLYVLKIKGCNSSVLNIINILNLLIKILNLVSFIDNNIHDIIVLNDNEEKTESNLKQKYNEYYMGKLVCKLIISIGLISWFNMTTDQSSCVLMAFIFSEFIDNLTEKVNFSDSLDVEVEKKEENNSTDEIKKKNED